MVRRVNFYSIGITISVGVVLILARSRFSGQTIDGTPRNLVLTENIKQIKLQTKPTTSSEGLSITERIFEETRLKVKEELWNYKFTDSGVDKLEDLLMESGGQPVRSVIISTWRSGSSFLGELLNAMPSNYYNFEPLQKYGAVQIRGSPYAKNATKFLKRMLQCDHSGMDDYFVFGKNFTNQFRLNPRLWNQCQRKADLCYNADFTNKFCRLFPFQSMKLVRFRLLLAEGLLADKLLNVKIVLLIRDPRGVIRSRRKVPGFCSLANDCTSPKSLCDDMVRDHVAARSLLRKYPNRLQILRFETLALNPNETSLQLLKFLRLSATESVKKFLNTHTKVEVRGPYATYRISRHVPFKWKHFLKFKDVADIQNACSEAMALWGYQLAVNASHMASKDFYPIIPYSVT